MFGHSMRRLVAVHFSNRRPSVIAIVGAFVVIAMSAVVPILIGDVIDRAVVGKRPDLLVPLVGAILAASAIKGVGIWVRKRWAGVASIGTEARIRAQMYEHLQAMHIGYHEKVPTGQLMSRASSDLQASRDFLSMIPITIGMFAFLITVSVILLLKDLPLALVALGGVPLMGILAAKLTRKLHPEIYETQQNLARLTSVAEETVTGIRVVKSFGREHLQVSRLKEEADRVYTHALRVIKLRAILQPIFDFYPALSLALVLWVGGVRSVNGELSPGTFVAFLMYVTQLQWPVRMIGWVAADAQKAATASERIFEVLDTKIDIRDHPNAAHLEIVNPRVTFDRVSFRIGDRNVITDFSLEIPAGESIALVGPTGCGKSTILRLLLRFVEPTGGSILIDGHDVRDISLQSLRNQIGTVFEESFLFSDTIAANVAFGRPGATEDQIVEAAVLAQAHDFISELPDGYATAVGEQGFTLSGGQRQRIAIARAILMDPKILLLDDATSAVDPAVEAEIRGGLTRAMRGRTTLIVARRPGSAALADRVVLMRDGSIEAIATHEELWATRADYREILSGSRTADRVGA